MALVKIVYVSTPDRRGPDLDRIGTVEDIDVDAARAMVAGGWATWATDEDVAESRKREAERAAEQEQEQALARAQAQAGESANQPVAEVPPAEPSLEPAPAADEE